MIDTSDKALSAAPIVTEELAQTPGPHMGLESMAFSFRTAALALLPLSVLAGEDPGSIETLRQQAAETAIQGCTAAIVTPAVMAFTKRAQEAGKVIASEADALAQMESIPQWKSTVLPRIRRTCACVMEEQLQGIRTASTVSDLNSAIGQLARVADPARMEELRPLLVRCAQEDQLSPERKQ